MCFKAMAIDYVDLILVFVSSRFEEEYAECMNSETNDYFTAGQLRCNPNGNYDEAQCIQQVTSANNDEFKLNILLDI